MSESRTTAADYMEDSGVKYLSAPAAAGKPDPASDDYLAISHTNLYGAEDRFNGVSRTVLKKVTISGMTVEFTGRKNGRLARWVGREDIKDIEIIADRVHIGTPVRFPQSNVVIRARELEFSGDGCIDTTPMFYQEPPEDVPYKGKPVSGRDGAKAGDITLFVSKLMPPNDDRPRLVACGSQGQAGSSAKEPPPGEHKDDPTKYATALTHHEHVNVKHGYRIQDPGYELDKEYWPKGRVVGAQLTLQWRARRSLKTQSTVKFSGWPDPKTKIIGRSASDSGEPGKGGNSGIVTLPAQIRSDIHSEYCDLRPGTPGKSQGAPGEKAPGPDAPVYMYMVRPYDDHFHWSTAEHVPVEKVDGDDQPDKVGGKGISNDIKYRTLEPTDWLHEYNIGTALRYVRDAWGYRNETEANRVIRDYQTALNSTTLPLDLARYKLELEQLDGRIKNKEDVYGNPPGWIPYLSAGATLNYLKGRGDQAFRQLFLAYHLRERCEVLEDRQNALDCLAGACTKKIEEATVRMERCLKAIPDLEAEKNKIERDIGKQNELMNEIEKEIKKIGEDNAASRARWMGAIGVLRSVLHVIPFGQPLTTAISDAAGKGLERWLKGDDGWKIADGVTDAAKTAWKENHTEIAKQFSGELQRIKKEQEKDKKDEEDWGNRMPKLSEDQLSNIRNQTRAFVESLNSEKMAAEGRVTSLQQQHDETAPSGEKEILLLKLREARAELDEATTHLAVMKGTDPEKMCAVYAARKKLAPSDLTDAPDAARKNLSEKKKELEKKITTADESARKARIERLGAYVKEANDIVNSLHQIVAPKDVMDDLVAQEIKKLRESDEFKGKIEELKSAIDDLHMEKENYAKELIAALQAVGSEAAKINATVLDRDATRRALCGLSGAQHHEIKMAAVRWHAEAVESLCELRYYFAKAHEYQFLQPLGYEIYNLKPLIEKFESQIGFNPDAADGGEQKLLSTLKEEDLKQLRTMAEEPLGKIAQGLLKDVEKGLGQSWLKYIPNVYADTLIKPAGIAALNNLKRESVSLSSEYFKNQATCTFDFVDEGRGVLENYRLKNARLIDIKLKKITVQHDQTKYQNGFRRFDLEFLLPREAEIYAGGDTWYKFTVASEEARARWKFEVSWNREKKVATISPGVQTSETLKYLTGLITDTNDMAATIRTTAEKYPRYYPSALTSVTITRTEGGEAPPTGQQGGAPIVDFELEFQVSYEQ